MNEQSQKRPLQDVAENADGYATYLSDVSSAQLSNKKTLETLLHEVRVHCRNTHIEGDGRFHAWRRARPVEKTLAKAIKDLERASQNIERAVYARRAHDDQVKALPEARRKKQLAKEMKKNPMLAQNSATVNSSPSVEGQTPQADPKVTSIYDLDKKRWTA